MHDHEAVDPADTAGYRHPLYARSLAEFGSPRPLSRSGGWLLERPIAPHGDIDAIGCYPLFACQDWSRLHEDLESLGSDVVSVAIVADPFGGHTLPELSRCFPDRLFPFKNHVVVDCSDPMQQVSKHHRYYSRRALRETRVEQCDPSALLDEWLDLYQNLITRHHVTGVQAFSTRAFALQLRIPGIFAMRAISEGHTVGAHLWYVHDDVAYSHLCAVSPRGYELNASYALYWTALEALSSKVNWLNLGAGAGTSTDSTDGLSRFKRGWSSVTRPAYFCGRVVDRERYDALTSTARRASAEYFPAYRAAER